jgi:hemolysin III
VAIAQLDLRPSWRGWMHAVAFFVAIPAGVLLVLVAEPGAARTGALVYSLSLMVGLGTSAAYHRLARTERARAVMQRLDHSTIYILIAGTYVPLCLVALPPAWGIPLLVAVAGGALVGVILKLTAFHRARYVSSALYPALGWAAVIAAPALVDHLTRVQLTLVVLGGLAYTIGIPVLFSRRPDPWPRHFGYHEVWHTFTVIAAVLHFAAVSYVVT